MMYKKIGTERERAELVRMLRVIKGGVVLHEPTGFELAGGGISDTYIDVKKAYGQPAISKKMAEMIVSHIDKSCNFVAASGHGGIPICIDLSNTAFLYRTLVRTEEKKHGKGGWVDGYVPEEGDRGIIVDDVLTTGGSIRKVRAVIEKLGAKMVQYFVVVKSGNPELDFDVHYLLDVKDLE